MALTDNILQYRGQDLADRDGDKIGSIEEIYLDTETEQPEWALVKTGLFGTKSTFVPIRDASEAEGQLRVPFEKDQVKGAPNIDAGGELSQQEEAELYRYYGMDYSEARSDTGLPEGGGTPTTGTADVDRDRDLAGTTTGDAGRERGVVGEDVSGPETDTAMTRSEEELRADTRQREAGRARLRKYVVTEPVETTVQTRREEVRVEREPITDANVDEATSGPELSEEEHEVVLQAEEPVVEKRVVPKERVRLDKDTVAEEQTVSDEVRREEIEIEGDDRPGPAR
jgi:uncharacterized protein (TIGR02271 family)